jgi:hypothetical protein
MCNCGSKRAGQLIAGFAGTTAFLALIALIIGLTTVRWSIDVATLNKCGNSKDAFPTDCDKRKDPLGPKRLLLATESTPTLNKLPSFFNPKETTTIFVDAIRATVKIVENQKDVKTKERGLRNFERLLASHVAANSDTCDTANDGTCRDPSKSQFRSSSAATLCAKNTDSTDCGEFVAGSTSPCKGQEGKCCCQCGSSSSNLVDVGVYSPSGSVCSKYICSSVVSTACTYSAVRFIPKKREPTCININPDSSSRPEMHSCSRYTINGKMTINYYSPNKCAGTRCTDEECCAEQKQYKNCGMYQSTACSSESDMTEMTKAYDRLLAPIRNYIMYACLASMLGVLPALIGSVGKMKELDCLGNTCGAISLITTPVLSMLATIGLAFWLLIAGVFINTACTLAKTTFASYEGELKDSCGKECLAAQKAMMDASCNIGSGFGATGILLFVVGVLGLITTIMVCIGFCNNKKAQTAPQVIIVQQQGTQMTAVTPVTEATVVKQ